ncbi:MAG: glutathione peroxidase [Bacteroidetes bacterium]|nr:glutathione peroxidase [Bacteroidota bacterium]
MQVFDLNKALNVHDFIPEEFKGKVLLIVNIASECGFTPQLKGLENLYQTYKNDGFEILAYPSNDFNQEPLSQEGVKNFCLNQFRVSFPIMEKCHVKGKNKAPLFDWLSDYGKNRRSRFAPFWNFHKYLVDREGWLVDYYFTPTRPESNKIKKAIEKLL